MCPLPSTDKMDRWREANWCNFFVLVFILPHAPPGNFSADVFGNNYYHRQPTPTIRTLIVLMLLCIQKLQVVLGTLIQIVKNSDKID